MFVRGRIPRWSGRRWATPWRNCPSQPVVRLHSHGPISAVTAGQYLAGFIEEVARYLKHPHPLQRELFRGSGSALLPSAILVEEHRGHSRVHDKALWIMKVTTVHVIILTPGVRSRSSNPCPTAALAQARKHEARSRVSRLAYRHSLSHIMWIVALVGMAIPC